MELLDVQVLLHRAEENLDQPPGRVEAHHVDRCEFGWGERRQVACDFAVDIFDGYPAERLTGVAQLDEIVGDQARFRLIILEPHIRQVPDAFQQCSVDSQSFFPNRTRDSVPSRL